MMLVVELLVLAIIALESVVHVYHWLKIRRRMKRIRGYLSKGHELQSDVPRDDRTQVLPWTERVNSWITETNQYLGGHSQEASISFMHFGGGMVRHLVYPGVHFDAQECFANLQERLDNLRGIMERPDVYF